MRKRIVERYDLSDDGKVIIKISTKRVEDLYSQFDKKSSFSKKDLDAELVTYLIDSVDEIGKESFFIKFYIEDEIDLKLKNKVENSIKQYFFYLQDLKKKMMHEEIKNSLIFIVIGLFFTMMSILTGEDERFFVEVLSEGMLVAGWVSLWEAMATLLIKWLPLTKKLKLYKRISDSEIVFS